MAKLSSADAGEERPATSPALQRGLAVARAWAPKPAGQCRALCRPYDLLEFRRRRPAHRAAAAAAWHAGGAAGSLVDQGDHPETATPLRISAGLSLRVRGAGSCSVAAGPAEGLGAEGLDCSNRLDSPLKKKTPGPAADAGLVEAQNSKPLHPRCRAASTPRRGSGPARQPLHRYTFGFGASRLEPRFGDAANAGPGDQSPAGMTFAKATPGRWTQRSTNSTADPPPTPPSVFGQFAGGWRPLQVFELAFRRAAALETPQ